MGGLIFAVVGGLVGGLIFAVVGGLASNLISKQEIRLIDKVQWSWTGMKHRLRMGLSAHLVLVLVGGLIGGGFGWLSGGVSEGMAGSLVGTLLFGMILGVVEGLLGGLSGMEVEHRTKPNQGIHRSGQSALLGGIIFGLSNGVFFGLAYLLASGSREGWDLGLVGGLGFGLVVGSLFGLLGGLRYGGDAWLRHYLLRLLLAWQGAMPSHYVHFLDFAAQRILLRKVGGGYIFIHRLLLDYFAKQYTGPETTEANARSKGK